jgi:hypothetical protein
MYKSRIYLSVYQHLTRGIAYRMMAGFLTCSPMIGRLPEVIKTQWQQDLPGLQNLQLRVQFRTCTGFPFTNGQRKPNRYTIIRWQKYEIYWNSLYTNIILIIGKNQYLRARIGSVYPVQEYGLKGNRV